MSMPRVGISTVAVRNFHLVVHHHGLGRQGRGGQQQHQGQGEFHEPDYSSWAARERTGGGAPATET